MVVNDEISHLKIYERLKVNAVRAKNFREPIYEFFFNQYKIFNFYANINQKSCTVLTFEQFPAERIENWDI